MDWGAAASLCGQPFPSCVRISFEASSECHAQREVPALSTANPCSRQPRIPPLRDTGQPWREVFVFECACFLFPPVFRPRDKQMWPEEGGEEQKKPPKRTISQRSIPNPGCLACQHPLTHRVLWGSEKAPQGSQPLWQRLHPNMPFRGSPPFRPPQGTGPARCSRQG